MQTRDIGLETHQLEDIYKSVCELFDDRTEDPFYVETTTYSLTEEEREKRDEILRSEEHPDINRLPQGGITNAIRVFEAEGVYTWGYSNPYAYSSGQLVFTYGAIPVVLEGNITITHDDQLVQVSDGKILITFRTNTK